MRLLASLVALAATAAAFTIPRNTAPRLALRLRAEGEGGDDAADAAGEAAKAAPEVNSGAEAIELLFKDPEGYKEARKVYDSKMREELMNEAPVDRSFFLQAAGVAVGSFAFGLFYKKAPPAGE